MELRHLRAFLAIAEERSITAASRRLFAAQPAVTRQLAQLERSLGTQLFVRAYDGVTLTNAGKRLEPEARRIVGLADVVVDSCRAEQSTLRGRLIISSPEEGLNTLTSVVLAAYRVSHPNVDVEIQHNTSYSTIETLGHRDNPFDVALWGLNFSYDQFHVDAVYSERIQLAVSEQTEIATAAAAVDIRDVLELPQVRPIPFMQRWAVENLFGAFRNGSVPRFVASDPFDHIADGVDDIIQGRAVTGVSTGTEPIPGVAFVSIDQDVQWSVGVITPAAERRQHVRNFGVIAANIGRELHALVPQAGPPPAAT